MTIPTMTEGPGLADPQAVLLQQLTERAAHDPLAALLLARFQNTPEEQDPLDALEHRFDAALNANAQLREALVAANRTTAWVARLTGACPQCWGLVVECRMCGGAGRPGFRHPDVGELLDWIDPALRRAGLTVIQAYEPQRMTEQEMEEMS